MLHHAAWGLEGRAGQTQAYSAGRGVVDLWISEETCPFSVSRKGFLEEGTADRSVYEKEGKVWGEEDPGKLGSEEGA